VVVVVELEYVHLNVTALAGLHRREPDPLELVAVKGGFVVGVRQLLAAVEEGRP
jgi:predicted hotdog family 3-hydroxylacyl-ACP dehydratase